ncbi:MAG TPA: sodium/proline symporter PutP [Bacillales bacterium]
MWEIITTFVIYGLFMLAIGVWTYFRTDSISDYILGGRKLSPWVAGPSAQASDFSGWLLLGLPGAVYVAGLSGMWLGISQIFGAYLNWQFIAKRLRLYTEKSGDSLTVPEFFENRFRDKTHSIRIISALFSLIFYMIYVASGIVAGAKLFTALFDMSYTAGLLLGFAVVFVYTLLGGFLAASITDMVQGFMMFAALIIAPTWIIFHNLGGLSGLWEALSSINPDLLYVTRAVEYNFGDGVFWASAGSASMITIIGFMAWGLGFPGQQHIIARFMGIRSAKDVPAARMIAIILVGFCLWGAIFAALAGIAYFDQPLADPEKVFLLMIPKLFNPWVAGFLLSAVLAAIMSTMSSQLVVASSALAEDFYKPFFHKDASPRELMWIGRIATVIIAGIALWIAFSGSKSVLGIVAYAWAGFGAVFSPAIIFSVWWKRATWIGILCGMIAGGGTVIVWERYASISAFFGVPGLYSLIPGFFFSCLVIWIVSLITPNHPEVEAEFEEALELKSAR